MRLRDENEKLKLQVSQLTCNQQRMEDDWK
jgi:hypothetical protein